MDMTIAYIVTAILGLGVFVKFINSRVAKIILECIDVMYVTANALKDGKMTAAEVALVKKELQEAIDAFENK